MKKLFLVGSYCDSELKLRVLKTNLEILKRLGVKTFLFSPFNLEREIIDFTDYFHVDKTISQDRSNPILFWVIKNLAGKQIKFTRVWYDSSLGVFHQMKSMAELSKNLDYDLFYFCLYDVIITKEIANYISEGTESFFPFIAKSNGYERIINCSSQLFSISKKRMESFQTSFNLEGLRNSENVESFLDHISKEINVEVNPNILIEDHIHTFKYLNRDFYNLSPFVEFKIFISNYHLDPVPKVMIYEAGINCEIFIRTGDYLEKKIISEIEIFEISPEFTRFEIWKDGVVFDVIDILKKYQGGWWEFIN